MTDFNRNFPIKCLTDSVLEQNSWFTDLLSRWHPAGDAVNHLVGDTDAVLVRDRIGQKGDFQHLRAAFRDGYMNFYCGGQSIAQVAFVRGELRARIHEKYVFGGKTSSERYVTLTSEGFPEYGTERITS